MNFLFKDVRHIIGDLIRKWINHREDMISNKTLKYFDDHPEMTKKEENEFYSKSFDYIQFNIDEFDYADMLNNAIHYSNRKVEETGRKDLDSWWFNTTLIVSIIKYRLFT